MKKVIVIILAILIAASGGLLVYGATLGDAKTLEMSYGELLPPDNPAAFAHGIAEQIDTRVRYDQNTGYRDTFFPETNPSKNPEIFAVEADGWYDVFGATDSSKSILTRYAGTADLVGNLIVPITYNQNRAKQFCMTTHYEVKASGKRSVSDNVRIRVQIAPFAADAVYLARAWAGSAMSSAASLYVYYGNQQFEYKSALGAIQDYDAATGNYTVAFGNPSEQSRDRDLDREVPFKTYDLLNLPIYLGGKDKNDSSPVDSSVVDASTVSIVAPTNKTPYYVLTFSEDLEKGQSSANLNDRLNKALGGKMSNMTLKQANFTVEIWESGVFRQVNAHFVVNAKMSGKQSDVEIDMTYKFYYDNKSCDIFSLIEQVGWEKYLSGENKAEFDERKAAWSKENAQ